MERKILRLPLIDILGRDTEEDVLYILQKIKEGLLFEFNILLWYRDRGINSELVKSFETKYAPDILKLNISVQHINGYEEHIWYDIINNKDANSLRKFKFRLTYETYSNLPGSLLEFSCFAKSYNKNGYRHDKKNSSNWVSRVGGPSKN